MKNTIFYPAATRFSSDHGWVKGTHYFNFGHYFDPYRTAFGPLLILNDDRVNPGAGFAEHPHENMEIISLPLSGSIRHKDNTDMEATIQTGDIQIMGAGTGIRHSETNASHTESVRFLQIWIKPDVINVPPRYEQITMNNQPDMFNMVVSPEPKAGSLFIQQQAWLHLGEFKANVETTYKTLKDNHGIYILLIEGEATVDEQVLKTGDALSITEAEETIFSITQPSKILVIEVPV